MIIKTLDSSSIKPFLKNLYISPATSHKGQNGRVLVIGGSQLFHSASIWAAEVASYFVDLVFYSSIPENNELVQESKKRFNNGIVVSRRDLESYIDEADSILIGPGMVRGEVKNFQFSILNFQNILKIQDEASSTYYLTKYILATYPEKKFVLDAGALQMMEKDWLLSLKTSPILTPHTGEYKSLFGEMDISAAAQKYKSVILLKAIKDTIAGGKQKVVVQGGNQGLTKGGTGDILAGLAVVFYAKNDSFTSAVLASYLLKKTADELFLRQKYWYNISSLIEEIPRVFAKL